MVNNVALTANEAEAYLVGGQLKKQEEKKGIGHLYQIQAQTHQLHIHLRQDKGTIQDTKTKETYIKH